MIISRKTEDFYYIICKTPYKGFWLGARDDVIEGTWVWSSDSVMTYTNWADGQPDNGHDEDCVEMKDKYSWKWNDNQCDEHRKYICEKM